jgi:hypothetical protein
MLFRYLGGVSTIPSKRLYTPAVGGSIPSAPTGVIAGQQGNKADAEPP